MSRTLKIYGMDFDLTIPREENRQTKTQAIFRTQKNKSLFECYKSVSGEKYRTFDAWKTWAQSINLDIDSSWSIKNFNVESHNTWHYTLSGVACDELTGNSYYIKITASNNYAYLLLDC